MQQPDHYDAFAESYARENERSLFNHYYARPAVLALAGDVDGRRVLDAGCGSGTIAADLRDRGAVVSGFDGSPAMLELARRRLGNETDLRVADLARPLPYPDGVFDDVVVSLVLHYLEDWSGPLAEVHRVLRPGGRLLVSVNHPIVFEVTRPEGDYFAVTAHTDDHEFDGVRADLTYWHRPLRAMTAAFAEAGFALRVIEEPPFSPDTPPELLPPGMEGRTAFLCFIFFVLEAA